MLPNIKAAWNTRPLGELCTIIMGQAPKGNTYNDKGIGTPLIAGAADLGQITPMPKKWTTSPTKLGMKGDVILCVRATIGDLNWADSKYCYGRGVCGVRVNSQIDPQFVWFWLEACKKHILSLGRGATFKQISKTDIAGLPVPDLDIIEQRRIVARIKECMEKLEEINGLRSKSTETASVLYKSRLTDLYTEMLSDVDLYQFKDIVLDTKLGLVRSRKEQSEDRAFPYVRMQDISNEGNLHIFAFARVDAIDREMNLNRIKKGDFLFNTRNSYELVGKTAIVPDLPETTLFNNNILRVRFKDEVIPSFVNHVFQHENVRIQLGKRKNKTTSVCAIYWKSLSTVIIPVPPIHIQNKFTVEADAIAELKKDIIFEMKDSKMMTSKLCESILRKAFAGGL